MYDANEELLGAGTGLEFRLTVQAVAGELFLKVTGKNLRYYGSYHLMGNRL